MKSDPSLTNVLTMKLNYKNKFRYYLTIIDCNLYGPSWFSNGVTWDRRRQEYKVAMFPTRNSRLMKEGKFNITKLPSHFE